MKDVKTVLGTRILIKKLSSSQNIGDIVIQDDGESLPIAEVVLVSAEVESNEYNRVKVGDTIHYTESRETGKCSHNGAEHFIIPISNAVAIL